MAIWLGSGGGVRLKRSETGPVYVHVGIGDIDATAKRMSADKAVGALITGDHVAIERVDEDGQLSPDLLEFMGAAAWPDGVKYRDGQWYVHVDPIGGVRFYSRWVDAIQGSTANALPLEEPSSSIRVKITLVEGTERCLGQTVSWELNTDREVADVTPLGEGFQRNMATLVSGSGSLECLFDAGREQCFDNLGIEKSIYLHQLALRQEIGANFTGVFLLKHEGVLPIDLSEEYRKPELFYLCECVISEVASSVDTNDVIRSKINFVTTGPIQLLYQTALSYLLQEGVDLDKVLQENDGGILLDLPI